MQIEEDINSVTIEYGRWPESDWISESIDWRRAKEIVAGVDIGTTSAQAAILCDGELFGYANIHVGSDFQSCADLVIERALGNSGMALADLGSIIGTGFGSRNISYASKTLDSVQCHGKGARYLFGPKVKTVIDLGGQNTTAISLYDWDRIRDFEINDKCATGIGRKVEMMCDLLQVPIDEIGEKSLDVTKDPEPVSTTCYNFMFPEVLGLLRQGFREDEYGENEVLAACLFAVAWRALGTIGKLSPLDIGDIKLEKDIAFTGGLAKNIGITKRIERELGLTSLRGIYDPQLAGAIGAALVA